jgi:hypothetical protein
MLIIPVRSPIMSWPPVWYRPQSSAASSHSGQLSVYSPKNYQTPYPHSKSGKIPGGEDVTMPDPLLPLGFAAGLTKTIRLATSMVILCQLSSAIHRRGGSNSGRLVARQRDSWDRLRLGQRRARGTRPRCCTRGWRTAEAIQAMGVGWNTDLSSFSGKHFYFGSMRSYPKPVRGHVPIHIGTHSLLPGGRALG